LKDAKKFITSRWDKLCSEGKLGGALTWYFTMLADARKDKVLVDGN